MQDRVADVLAQRAALDRGPAAGVALSILLHAAIFGGALYAAMHSPAPKPAKMVSIEFASMPAAAAPPARSRAATPAPAPTPAPIEEPKPVIQEPKPAAETPAPAPPEKNTVPLSPFGRSSKKGSETPATPLTSAPSLAGEPGLDSGATSTAPAVAVGGSGVTGVEGGDFPYALYLQGMHKKIGGNWTRPSVAPGATTIIYLRIARDGKITESRVETSSGNGNFDRAALSAVRSSSPLNPLPFAYSGTYLGVRITFR